MAGLYTNAGVERLETGDDMAENWRKFRDSITSYIDAYYEEASQKRKISILTFHGGEILREVIQSLPKVKEEKFADLIRRLNAHFQPKLNVTYQRYLFLTRKQNDEACEQYMTVLKNLARKCEFGELTDSLTRDVFICGLRDVALQQALLRMPDKTGEEVIEFCKTQISVMKQVENIKKENNGHKEEINIDLVKKQKTEKRSNEKEIGCKYCGYKHEYGKCPAYGKNCKKCGKVNHFASVCLSNIKKVNLLDDGVEEEDWFVGALGEGKTRSGWYTAVLEYQGVEIEVKVDTGAQCNVLSAKQYRQLNGELKNLRPVKTCITSFTGDRLNIIGQCSLTCWYKGKGYDIDFMVVDLDCFNILGLKTAEQLELILRVNELLLPQQVSNVIPYKYLRLFDGKVGLIQQEINIEVNSDVKPVVSPLRRVPYSLENKIKAELDRMQAIGIIEPVSEPTDWVSQMVVVQKTNGSLRICLDPRALNQATKRAHYPLPTLEEICSKLNGAKHFCKLDAQSGFWMLPLSRESSRLCTFQTKWGRYAFLRLPFGLNVAPEIFHKIINETFRDISNVETFQDDILMWANSKEELEQTLHKVLETAFKRGIKFNPNKFEFDTNEITFLGHRFSKEGITVDVEKVKAIQEIKTPTDKKSLQRVLGMFNFLSRFIENFSEKAAPLRDLLRKDSQFRWEPHHEKSLQILKECISSSQVLSFYDPNQELVLSVDASSVGLGATLLQNGRPLGYSSKSLTETQIRYSQIEKELLAVCFGVEKYRQYLFGKDKIKVQTDHKPLVGIFNKPLYKIPARLQRMMLRLQPYRLSISHTPGKYMYLADALSRDVKITGCDKETSFDDVEYQISMLIENLPVTNEYWKIVTDNTLKDKTLTLLKTYLLQGWPPYKQLPEEIKPYYNYKSDLTVIKELVFVGDRILIPQALQCEMLKKLHTGHPGMNRMVNRSELTMFWLGINQDIKKFVKNCKTCQKFSYKNIKLELTSKPVPSIPWTEVGCDVFELYNEYYLVVVDALSYFIEVVKLPNLKSVCIIERFKSIFARHGIPVKLYSDGALYFDSELFKQFAKEWGFQHILSSPHYPKSNGLAESAVKTIKLLFKKAKDSNQDPHLALLNLRATPRGSLPSPAAMLMGRNLRTNIPCAFTNIVPKYEVEKDRELIIQNKLKSKMWYDRTATKRDRYEKGQDILYKKMPDSLWEPGKIVDCSDNPNSYRVMSKNGRVYTRNEMHIKPKESSIQQEIPYKTVETEVGDKEVLGEEEREDSVRTRSGRVVKPPSRFKDYIPS